MTVLVSRSQLGEKLNVALARACLAKQLSMELQGQLTLEKLPADELRSRMERLRSGQQKLGWAMR